MTEFTNQIRTTFLDELDLNANSVDVRQLNISQEEYADTYKKYVELREEDLKTMAKENSIITPELDNNLQIQRFHTFNATTNDTIAGNTLIFPINELHEKYSSDDSVLEITRASLRILMPTVIPTVNNKINLKIYDASESSLNEDNSSSNSNSGKLIISKEYEVKDLEDRWIDFDVESTVESNLINNLSSLKLIVVCDTCKRSLTPLQINQQAYLNILITIEQPSKKQNLLLQRIKRTTNTEHRKLQLRSRKSRQNIRPYCNNQNTTKCCRYPLSVTFKDLESFEFILEPKSYDAGYCKGHCPVRYNPANKHALIQSLVWKKDRRAPKPCCAPKKYSSLQIIYLDKNNKMKVTKWPKMSVVDCACI
ncbi:protein dbl-1 [Chrysoperla carnea]|uniref:protein dbl-1 n=1 Tax=Chrysoperla carnea TaxID=189513 RepID=UPI001D0648A8|nr:protein dbl-1 [Chrysoperla carnea]